MQFNQEIFKAYDIRGLVQGELSEELAYRLGRAFAAFLRTRGELSPDQAIVVGRDMRESSPFLAAAVIRGIQEEGVDVVNIGLTTTPLFYFSCANYNDHGGGIMITASHNPAQYNGFKLVLSSGLPVGKNSGMEAIRDLVERNDFLPPENLGTITVKDFFEDYANHIFSLVKPEGIRPLRIVVDAGNGMADITIPKILKRLPVDATYLFLEPDGTFPNHEANPLKTETLKELQKKVLELKADFGFALDGDADRIGLVDEKGRVVDASFVGALIGLEVLREHSKGLMLYDLRSSMMVKEAWEKAGATTEKCMVGHALIKKLMADNGADFACELSGHIYFSDNFNMESTDLCLLYIMQMLSRDPKPLSEWVRPLQKYYHSGEMNFSVRNKTGVLAALEKEYKKEAKEISYLDGLWMSFDWGWLNARASNTEPVLRLNLEATSQDKMATEFLHAKKIIGAS